MIHGLSVSSMEFVQASVFSIESISQETGLGAGDLKETIINIVHLVTGFLTLVSLFMLTIGGFRWVTSGSSDEFKDQAKRMIQNAIVGEILVLLSWSILMWTLGFFRQVTQ